MFLYHTSSIGVYGRMWMSGTEADVAAARDAAIIAINSVSGKQS